MSGIAMSAQQCLRCSTRDVMTSRGRCLFNAGVCLMLVQRLRRWPNIKQTSGGRLVFAGIRYKAIVVGIGDQYMPGR